MSDERPGRTGDRRDWHKRFYAALVLVGVVITLLVVLCVVRIEWSTQASRALLDRVAGQLPVAVHVDTLAVSPLRGQIDIRGLRIAPPHARRVPFFEADHIGLRWDWRSLVRGRYRMAEVTGTTCRLNVSHLGGDRYDILEWFKRSSKDTAASHEPSLELGRLVLRGLQVSYHDPFRRMSARVNVISLDSAFGSGFASGAMKLNIADGQLSHRGRALAIRSSHVRVSLNGGVLQIPECVLASARSELRLSGAVLDSFGKKNARLQAHIDGHLDDFRAWWPKPVSGVAQADVELAGPVMAPRWRATLALKNALLDGYPLREGQFWLHGTRAQLEVDRAAWRGDWGAGNVVGRVTLEAKPTITATLRFQDFGVLQLARHFRLGSEWEQLLRVSGDVQVAIRHGDYRHARASGQTRLVGVWRYGQGQAAIGASGTWQWARDGLLLRSLSGSFGGGTIRASGAWYPYRVSQPYRARVDWDAIRYEMLAPLLGQSALLHGRLGGHAEIQGDLHARLPKLAHGRIRFSGVLPPAMVSNVRPMPLSVTSNWRVSGRRVLCEGLQASLAKGWIVGSVAVPVTGSLYSPDLQGHFRITGCQVSELNRAMQWLDGPLAGELDATVALSGDRLDLRRFALATLGGRIAGQGVVTELDGAMPYRLTCVGANLRVEDLTRALLVNRRGWTGRIGGHWLVSGVGAAYRMSGPTSIEAIAPETLTRAIPTPLRANGDVTCTSTWLETGGVQLDWGGLQGTLSGRYDLGRAVNVVMQAVRGDTSPQWGTGANQLSGGRVACTLHLSGPLTDCAYRVVVNGERLRGRLRNRLFQTGKLSLDSSGKLNRRLQVVARLLCRDNQFGTLAIRAIDVPLRYDATREAPESGQVNGAGTVSLTEGQCSFRVRYGLGDDRIDCQARTRNLVWDDLAAGLLAQSTALPANTPVSAMVKVRGRMDALTGIAEVGFGSFQYGGQWMGTTSLKANLRPDGIQLAGHIFGDQVAVDGHAALAPLAPSRLRVRLANGELEPIVKLVPAGMTGVDLLPLGGQVAGECLVEGPWGNPRAARVSVLMQQLRLRYREGVLRSVGPLELNVRADALECRRVHMEGLGHLIRAEGLLSVREVSHWRASGQINLDALEKLAPLTWTDARGTCDFDAAVSGVLGGPDATGTLNLQRGSLSAQALLQPITDFSASLRLSRDELFVERLGFQVGDDGRVSALGQLKLGLGYVPTRVALQCNARQVTWQDDGVTVAANADLALAGPIEALQLSGQVRVLDARVTRSVAWETWLTRNGGPREGPIRADRAWWRDTGLRLQCLIPDSCRIENEVLKANLRGDLTLLGTLRRPAILGRIEAGGGQLVFQDHVYQLHEAAVDFIDAQRVKPLIHVLATTQITPHQVTMAVDGTPESLKLDMTSTPPLPQADLLLMMATGQGAAQLEQGRDLGLETASSLALGFLSRSMERGVKGTGMVDVLRIQPGLGQAGDTRGGQFTIGKRVNEQLTVTYTQGVSLTGGTTVGSIVVFDYVLGDRLVLKLEQNLAGGFNGSARYRFAFR